MSMTAARVKKVAKHNIITAVFAYSLYLLTKYLSSKQGAYICTFR